VTDLGNGDLERYQDVMSAHTYSDIPSVKVKLACMEYV
jgi:hypothetical protein